jgi:hypothetical protein
LPNEGAFLTDSLPYPERFGWPRMWCRCLEDVRLEPGPDGAERAERIKRQWSVWYPKEAANLVEKTISNAARMPFLEAYFQPAYFINIVRNGYAVAAGIRRKANLRRWGSSYERYPIELCAEQWRTTDEIVERDRHAVGRFLQIYYEDLTAEPSAVMKQITDFLGLPPMPSDVWSLEWHIHEVTSTIQNMNERNLDELTRDDLRSISIEDIAGVTLQKHGYMERQQPLSGRLSRQ